jgi:hypothetical protein
MRCSVVCKGEKGKIDRCSAAAKFCVADPTGTELAQVICYDHAQDRPDSRLYRLVAPGRSSQAIDFSLREGNIPKQPLSSFMFFCKDRRAEIIRQEPSITFAKINERLHAIWKSLSPAEMRPYQLLHFNDNKRYKKEMRAYNRSSQIQPKGVEEEMNSSED